MPTDRQLTELGPSEFGGCRIAMCRAFRELGVSQVGLKWPNDVLVE